MDLDTTADVHDEHTADLTPSTVDIVPADVPPPALASAAPEPVPAAEAPIVAKTTEPRLEVNEPIVARTTEPPLEVNEPMVAREERAPLPFGRREPFVSAQPTTSAPRAPEVSSPRVPEISSTSVTEDVGGGDVAKATTTVPSAPAPAKAVERQPPALAPGKVLCDRYLLEQVIGCGGTAIVFRARDMLSAKGTAPNIQVAIKTPRPELGDPERAAKRLKHEFEHAKLLSHPSIVRVHELHEDEGRSFMTMELIQGKLLSQLLRDWTMVPPALAHKILSKCAEALQYAHSQNVAHGDFKPGNVFITADEGVRIVDFGTAAGPSTNESRIPAGTPTYASPEVLSGETPDARDDVFSFACVAYELLTGQHPFGRQSSLQARDEGKIPPRAWNLSTSQWLSLLSALSWKREQRPTGVEDLLTRLSPERPVAIAPAPVHADPEEVVPAELPADLMPKQRSWGFFAFIACALLVTYFAFQRQNASDDGEAPTAPIVPAVSALPPAPTPAVMSQPAPAEVTATPAPEPEAATVTPEATKAPVTAAKPRPAAPMSEISFESSSIVTSESSVAAVFLIKRSQPLTGRVSVSWKTISGTADAGIDFASGASGTVTFADGQAQRAIYVPLRNDLLKEDDETFYVELVAPKSARLGKVARAQAIIRDDD
ncbi:protein kinase domain-containing protein [Steroidobacter sp.]|uniref:protein kinase domain-containing protein n=1 Tax=Steroidobacter sp. TaxID=1978227 RepID=UPI001A4E1B4A|nr:protein kinase [Steroidobacter sp.]MBL8271068.1 protein kinase [Steroidobacter sp.]